MPLAVDNPILNNSFEEPKEYWIYEKGVKEAFEKRDLSAVPGTGRKEIWL